jgi:rsbT co-antagonist protein RsbR
MVERFRVAGIELEYDIESGIHRWAGNPSLAVWLETSIAGLMAGLHRMVGTERFNISLQSGGRDSTQGDWDLITRHPTFEAGFIALANVAAAAGWGRWQLIEMNKDAKEARFRVLNSWESFYQRALGVDWGSSYVGGKFAGHCARLFDTNCWAEQTKFIVKGDPFDEFIVRASTTTVEAELDNLLASDKGTRAISRPPSRGYGKRSPTGKRPSGRSATSSISSSGRKRPFKPSRRRSSRCGTACSRSRLWEPSTPAGRPT